MFYTGLRTSCVFSLYNTNRLGLVSETESVYYAVQTEPVIPTQGNFVLLKVNIKQFNTEQGSTVGKPL